MSRSRVEYRSRIRVLCPFCGAKGELAIADEWIRCPACKARYKPERAERPTSRSQCAGGRRPCPFVGCRYHLYLDVTPSGSIKFNFPGLEPWEIEETCALDVAEAPHSLREVAKLMNVVHERVRMIEAMASVKMREGLREHRSEEE